MRCALCSSIPFVRYASFQEAEILLSTLLQRISSREMKRSLFCDYNKESCEKQRWEKVSYSKSVYFIPVLLGDYYEFINGAKASGLWADTSPEKFRPRYLLNYAARIADDDKLFRSFELKNKDILNVYMYEKELDFENTPEIEEVRLSCFSTGVAFLEFWVSYSGLTPEEIADFAYLFKKAAKMSGKTISGGKVALYDAAASILPSGVESKMFFSVTETFKYECVCFHFLHVDEVPSEEKISTCVRCLSRSYNAKFLNVAESDYDMIYEPSKNDYWGGSSEGMVNIVFDVENDDSNYYLHNIKLSHLSIDYYFLYLLLLNQKFTAVEYINKVSMACAEDLKKIEEMNREIIKLKTVFSFNVISDDRIFQNVYSKMYSVLEIERLLADVIENEGQLEILQNSSSAKADKLSSKFLFAISMLSLFSALIDASSYFDRIQVLQSFSTLLGFLSVCLTIVVCLVWLIKGLK